MRLVVSSGKKSSGNTKGKDTKNGDTKKGEKDPSGRRIQTEKNGIGRSYVKQHGRILKVYNSVLHVAAEDAVILCKLRGRIKKGRSDTEILPGDIVCTGSYISQRRA